MRPCSVIGLVYAHYKNPKRDYKKSIKVFKKLIHDYPNSPFVEQAKVWSDALQTIQDSQNKVNDLKKKNDELENIINDLQMKNDELENIIDNLETVDTEIDQKSKNKSN